MKENIRKIYRFCVQAKFEGKRSHDALMRIMKKIPSADSLLDVGCGNGDKTQIYGEFLSVPRNRIFGIELKKKYMLDSERKISVKQIDLEKDPFPFGDQEIHTVICNQVLEHLKNIFLPLGEMDRVTRKGGYIVIGIPNLAALHNRMLILVGRQPLCNEIVGPHVRCFSHKAFLKFLKENHNFRLVSFMGATIYPFPYPFVEIAAKYFPAFSANTFYLLQKVGHYPDCCVWSTAPEVDSCW
jgi:ubiquinone/menaquinone biosynthesis C-methylase UbiE